MPTARELLEQADALMRRNRRRGKGPLDASTLTGVLEARTRDDEPSTVILPETPSGDVDAIVLEAVETVEVAPAAVAEERAAREGGAAPSSDDHISLDTLADLPVLTDVVVDWEETDTSSASVIIDAPHESSDLLMAAFPRSAEEAQAVETPAIAIIERQLDDGSATDTQDTMQAASDGVDEDARNGAVKDVSAVTVASEPAPSPFLDDDFILEIPPLHAAEAATPSPPPPSLAEPASPNDGAAWAALAEELRMQVLQRLDLFTDTGLREQLGERLSPIVERASTQMIETINRELGELVRAYVAEAIEREIETWRNRADI